MPTTLSHAHKAFFTVAHSPFLIVLTAWCTVLISTLLVCGIDCICRSVWRCCLCDVLCCIGKCWEKCTWFCATHTPPSHSRSSLCIYTSGSSRSPQSLCSFKSPPCIYPSALVLSFSPHWHYRCCSCNQTGTLTHIRAANNAHNAINKHDCYYVWKKWGCRASF